MTRTARTRFRAATAALLACLIAAQIFSASRESTTGDEPLELAAGYSYLKTGDFRMNPEHPPLAKILAALPLLMLRPSLPLDSKSWATGDEAAFGMQFLHQNGGSFDADLFAARMLSVLLAACLGLAIVWWTRAAFGPQAALFALALYAFDPTAIAHGHYVKNDLPAALFCFLAVIAWCGYLNRPTPRRLAVAGLGLGLALATKFSALFLLPVLVILYAIGWWQRREGLSLRRGLGALLAVFTIGAVVVWLIYAGFSGLHAVRLQGISASAGKALLDRDQVRSYYRLVARGLPRAHPYVEGLLVALDHDTFGHPCYLLGMQGTQGWWYYFPVAFAVKLPAATLAALALAGVLVVRRLRRARPRSVALDWYGLAVPAAVFWAFAMHNHLNIGIRHLLPVWPFAFVFTSAALTRLPLPGSRAVRAILITGVVVESMLICPHYTAFFNVFAGGPSNGPRILADSNIDWGQDARNLATWLREHHASRVCLDYFGSADIGRLGVQGPPVPETSDTQGRAHVDCFAAISTNILYDAFGDPQRHAWLRAMRPVARVGYSIYVYDLRKDATH